MHLINNRCVANSKWRIVFLLHQTPIFKSIAKNKELRIAIFQKKLLYKLSNKYNLNSQV